MLENYAEYLGNGMRFSEGITKVQGTIFIIVLYAQS